MLHLLLAVPAVAAPSDLQILVPAYFYPPASWDSASEGADSLIANPYNGPGLVPDPNYVAAIDTARAEGTEVIGYVYTSYGSRPAQDVEDDVASWYAWYAIDGIFFDETPGEGSCAALDGWYQARAAAVRAHDPAAVVVLNPGTHTCESTLAYADRIVVFEGFADDHPAWTPRAWMGAHPAASFVHLVHTAAPTQVRGALVQVLQQDIGWLYVTDDALPNPWDRLPAYWQAEWRFAAP